MTYKQKIIPIHQEDIDHVKSTTLDEIAKAKINEENFIKKLELINDKALPIDVLEKRNHMKAMFDYWDKNPDKPTNKTLKDYDEEYSKQQ